MRKNRTLRGILCLLLVVSLVFGCGATARAIFSTEDETEDLLDDLGWDFEGRISQTYTVPGGTEASTRSSVYMPQYYDDLMTTTKKYLGISDASGSAAAIVALAELQYELCCEEVAGGVYNSRREYNGDDNTMYAREILGCAAAWCCAFISWLARECGLSTTDYYSTDASTPYWTTGGCTYLYENMIGVRGFEAYGFNDTSYTPVPGDLLLFKQDGVYGGATASHPYGVFQHIGIVTEVNGTQITVIEGNHSNRVTRTIYDQTYHYSFPNSASEFIHVIYPASEGSQYIYTFLTDTIGYSSVAACAVMGNMMQESRLDPTAENSIGAYGLCQWLGSRRSSLESWCSANGYDYTTAEGQMHFLQYELNGTEAYANNAMLGYTSDGQLYSACQSFMTKFERPGDSSLGLRYNYASRIYSYVQDNDFAGLDAWAGIGE